jgi:4-hydroxy-tetrahydrodipicolinate reductase
VDVVIDVLVTGAAGRMGALSAATIAGQDDLRLVALVDPHKGDGGEVPWFKDVGAALALTTPAAALEFSVPGAVYENSAALLEAGVPTVIGATGLSDDQVADLSAVAEASGAGLVVVPNFALGAVLLMKFAAEAARHYEHAEIIEIHEKGKIDAPSGTSLRTARLMAQAPGSALAAPPGADQASRGLVADGRVTIHSVRLPGAVAHQEVVFGGQDELLTLRHDSLSRRSFMSGVLLALRRVTDVSGTVVGLENLLD